MRSHVPRNLTSWANSPHSINPAGMLSEYSRHGLLASLKVSCVLAQGFVTVIIRPASPGSQDVLGRRTCWKFMRHNR
jgi:hypothetical protein